MHAAKIIITFSTQFSFGYLKLTPHMVAVRGRLKMSSFIYLFCFHILAWRKLHIEWPKKKKITESILLHQREENSIYLFI